MRWSRLKLHCIIRIDTQVGQISVQGELPDALNGDIRQIIEGALKRRQDRRLKFETVGRGSP